MGTYKKKYEIENLLIAIIILLAATILTIHHLFLTTPNVVKPAISLLKARRLVKEDDYYIIYQDKGLFDEGYTTYCYDGKNKKPVVLIGKNPFNMHGDNGNDALFCGMARNKFLVKGTLDNNIIQVEEWKLAHTVWRDKKAGNNWHSSYFLDERD